MSRHDELPLQPDAGPVPLRWIEEQDVRQVVDLHLGALPPSFFSRLGPRFLREYYRCYVRSPYAGGVVARRDGALAGFVVGSFRSSEHAAWTLRRHGPRLAAVGLVSLLLRPPLLLFFLRTRAGRYVRGVRRRLLPASAPVGAAPAGGTRAVPAVLSHVAVDPAWRGQRLGEALVRSFCAASWQRGAAELELVTLSGDDGAGPFYDRLGFARIRERRDEDGRAWTYYRVTDTA